MSEEKQDIIEFLKYFCKTNIDYCKLEKTDVLDILNLIDKLQKEIAENKKIIKILNEMVDELTMKLEIEEADNKYNQEEASEEMIPRYVIRNKIKELEKDIEVYSIYEENWNKIEVLKELLGE